MIEDTTFYLPFPPTVNDYYGNRGYVKYVKKKGKLFRDDLRQCIIEQTLGSVKTIDEPINVQVRLFMPDKRRRDLDNYMKALLDACSPDEKNDWPGIWEDDSLIDQLSIYRGKVINRGVVIMDISPAGPIVPYPTGYPIVP